MNQQQVQAMIAKAVELASNNQQAIAVSICDTHGELLGFLRMDGVSLQAGVLAQNKAYTSARDRQPSGNLGAWAAESGTPLASWTDARITGFAGGVPIEVAGEVVGAIGISGLAQEDDEALALNVIHSVL
ncbi:heme-binding protein [Vibrio sp. SCSIO 43136]|uniref:GlcG/HbpS family heme-binding protein n=1 Tax=Vibrio sp. SCSIO 43136 TaxID=2819101 RepID=UPI002075D82D|nr:heme-binding protein [Vibrio sp. SCSIO 43136]USD67599.1 heme-binding protein [Vibrio sp. SCSIO 43136]